MVKVICYDDVQYFKTAQEAIDYFTEGMMWCDEGSSEYERYSTIVSKLEAGLKEVSDNYWSVA